MSSDAIDLLFEAIISRKKAQFGTSPTTAGNVKKVDKSTENELAALGVLKIRKRSE